MACGTPPKHTPLLAASYDRPYDDERLASFNALTAKRSRTPALDLPPSSSSSSSSSSSASSSSSSASASASSPSSSALHMPTAREGLRRSDFSPPRSDAASPFREETAFSSTPRSSKRYLKGRPPWYDASGSIRSPFIIGVAGGSGSGKTTVCQKIIEQLKVRWVAMISMDSFYKGLNADERANAHNYDFDHPAAIDFDKLIDVLSDLKQGRRSAIPIYDFVTHSRLSHSTPVYGADVILIEGILLLYDERIRMLLDMKIFVDTPADTRLARRLRRDVAERGRTPSSILEQYERFVKPSYDEFVHPTKDYAHLVIPYGTSTNSVAINVIAGYVQAKLEERGYVAPDPRQEVSGWEDRGVPSNIKIMEATNQSRALHTIIRDKRTTRDDFCFYADRLSRMAVEFALSFLPAVPKSVVAPTGATYEGLHHFTSIASVSIMRSGEAMERAVREVCSSVRIGKILIQSLDKKPRLFYCKLPRDIDTRKVLLLEPTLATGAALKMAIRVLLDHGVLPENIYVITLIASMPGLYSITYSFPTVQIITTEIEGVDENYYCSPGIGNFGSRYFGD